MKSTKWIMILALIFLTQVMKAQEPRDNNFIGSWELDWITGGFFPHDDLIFKKSDAKEGQYIFHFDSGGILSQNIGVEGMGECPVGTFILEKGTWRWDDEDGYLILALKGNKIADYRFDYVISYVPELAEGALKLGLAEVSRMKQTK